MLHKLNNKSVAIQFACALLYGVMFFVQLQVRFIENAYGDDGGLPFVKKSESHSATSFHFISKASNDGDKGYTKLNKRYPLGYTFTLLSAQVITQPSFAFAYLHRIYTQPFLTGNFNNAFSHRGPPAFHLS